MGLIRLVMAVVAELLGAVLGRGRGTDASSKSQRQPVGVVTSQLTQLQARCFIAACAFWAVVAAFSLPSLVLFGILLIPIWAVAEVAFFISWWFIYRHLNAQPAPHRPPPHVNPRDVFDRFIHGQAAMSKYIDILKMISTWHGGIPVTELTRENVADLLCYGFYYRSREQLADEGMGHVPDQLVSELETAWSVKFACSQDGKPYVRRRIMTHLWDPVRCFYRPLAFYAGVEVLIALKHVMLLAAGFQAHTYQGMRYYTYGLPAAAASAPVAPSQHRTRSQAAASATNGPSAADADAAVLFLHGVGLGLLPYLNFLLRLSSLERPVVAVEVRHLSMRVCLHVPDEDEVVACIAGALRRHGVRQVHAVAHSYGTFMASRLVQLHRPVVASLTLLDPVCFVMFSGKLIYNFVYRNPVQGASAITWFIARDLAHAVSVSRRFYWSLLNLWPDQLPDHTLVALSAQDELVPVQEVLTMLKERPGVRVRVHDGHRHAEFIKDLPEQAHMVQMVAELIEQATTAVAAASTASLGRVAVLDSASDLATAVAADACANGPACHPNDRNRSGGPGGLEVKPPQPRPQLHLPSSHSHARSDSASSYDVSVLAAAGNCHDWKKSVA